MVSKCSWRNSLGLLIDIIKSSFVKTKTKTYLYWEYRVLWSTHFIRMMVLDHLFGSDDHRKWAWPEEDHIHETVMSPHTILRKLLVHPKDKRVLLSTTGCISEVPCANCNESYVGETGRRLEARLNEHRKETEKVEKSKRNFTPQTRKRSESEQSKSAIADHAVQHNHVINWQDAKILAKECVSDVRHIKEAIWIRRRAPNTMNRDEGAHYLHVSHVYDPLLATSTFGDGQNRRGDQVPSFWWSVLTRTHETVSTSKFWFWQMKS